MCLAVPAEIIAIDSVVIDPLLRSAIVDFGGLRKSCSLALVPEATVGNYVLVHAGVAISIMNVADALESKELLS